MVLSKNHAQRIFDHIFHLPADDDHGVGSIVHLKNMSVAELDDQPDYLLNMQVCNVCQMTARSLLYIKCLCKDTKVVANKCFVRCITIK